MKRRGFTLLELLIGIIVLGIAITFFINFLFVQARNSTSAVQQVRGIELAQSFMQEISSKRFDEATNPNGRVPACGVGGDANCTEPTNLGPDSGETGNCARALYDDVDDYHGCVVEGTNLVNAQGEPLGEDYRGFSLSVEVFYDQRDALPSAVVTRQKRIEVSVTLPDDTRLTLSSYRGNY